MKDTSEDMRKKQVEIMLALKPVKRFMYGVDMIDFTYNMVKERILKHNPKLKGKALALQIFLEYYGHDFEKDELNRIIAYFQK